MEGYEWTVENRDLVVELDVAIGKSDLDMIRDFGHKPVWNVIPR